MAVCIRPLLCDSVPQREFETDFHQPIPPPIGPHVPHSNSWQMDRLVKKNSWLRNFYSRNNIQWPQNQNTETYALKTVTIMLSRKVSQTLNFFKRRKFKPICS